MCVCGFLCLCKYVYLHRVHYNKIKKKYYDEYLIPKHVSGIVNPFIIMPFVKCKQGGEWWWGWGVTRQYTETHQTTVVSDEFFGQ